MSSSRPPGGLASSACSILVSVSRVCADTAAELNMKPSVPSTIAACLCNCRNFPLPLCRCGRRKQFINTKHRIQIVPGIPGRVTPQEELQACARARGEGCILLQPAREFGLQLGALLEHFARDLLGDVRLHVLLLLEARVEEAPRGE